MTFLGFNMIRVLLTTTAVIGLTSTVGVNYANAVVLNFEDLGLGNFDDIPGEYGDNVTSTNDGVGSYLEGNGFTPNISVEYRTFNPSDGSTLSNNLDYWSDNYGDLVDVAYPIQDEFLGEITLIPEPGYSVRLNSFDLAGYPGETQSNQTVMVLDHDFNTLVDYSPFNVTGIDHNTFTPNIVSSQAIRIQYGTSWNAGIDNINFDQEPVPEPLTILGSVTALGIGGLLKRKHSKKQKKS